MDQATNNDSVQDKAVNSAPKTNVVNEIYDEILEKDILDLMGVGDLPENEKEEIYKKMLDTIMNRVILRLDSQVSDEEVAKLKTIMEAKDNAGFFKFFEDKGIDIKSIFAEEAGIYKVEMVALTSQGGVNDNK
jgi:hypothetical protein